jgi:hypothetical protein
VTGLFNRALSTLVVWLSIAACPALAGETSSLPAPGDQVPLHDSDLQAITLLVLDTHPQLSASPGIKYAEAWRNLRHVSAQVVFHPHAETVGVKTAYQAHCNRDLPNGSWSCPAVFLRRYVKLDSQDFEVRVRGSIDIDGVLALIEATRGVALTGASDSSRIPDTAIIVIEANGGYLVNWGGKDGMGQVDVEVFLREGGNPANPDDWKARLFQPET